MRKTEKTIAGQTKVVLEVSVFDDDDIEEIKLHFRKEPNISVSLSELEVLNLFVVQNKRIQVLQSIQSFQSAFRRDTACNDQ